MVAEHNRSALECLRGILSDETQPAPTRVSAARTLMRYANEYIGLRTTFEKSCDTDQAFDALRDDATTRALERFRAECDAEAEPVSMT